MLYADSYSSGSFPGQNPTPQTQYTQRPIIPADVLARIEEAKGNGWGKNLSVHSLWGSVPSAWFERRAGKLVLALILIIGSAGIFLSVSTHPSLAPSTEITVSSKEGTSIIQRVGDGISQIVAPKSGTPLSSNEVSQEKPSAPAPVREAITEVAQKGEGVTHLARRAVAEYLKQHEMQLSPEQRVYAEDYARKAVGAGRLVPAEELSFSQDLLKDAVSLAQALSTTQIQHLHTYAERVKWE